MRHAIFRQSIAAAREWIGRAHTDERRIVVGAAWVAGFVLLGKLAGAAKEVAIAWRYGLSDVVDAYQLAFTIVLWLPGTMVSIFSIVLIPVFVRLRGEASSSRDVFVRELHGSLLVVGLGLGILSVALCPFVLPHFSANLSESSRQMAWQLTLGLAPTAPLVLLIGLGAVRLMARERRINTLLEAVPAMGIFFCVILWPSGADISPLLWGTLVGTTLHAVSISYLAKQTDGHNLQASLTCRSEHWQAVYRSFAVLALGQFVMSCITPLDQYTAARLGDGALATISYANRITALLIGIGAVAISRAALPLMAELHTTGGSARALELAFRWAKLMIVVGALGAALMWLLAPWVISALFERGAFTSNDTTQVVEVFRWGLGQLPFYFAGLVLVQLLAGQGRYGIISMLAASNFIVKFILNPVLSSWMGLAGIALATSLMAAWSAFCLYAAAKRLLLPQVR